MSRNSGRKRKVKPPEAELPLVNSPKKQAHKWLDTLFEKASWVPTVLVGILNLAGGVLLATLGNLDTTPQKARLALGVIVLLVALAIAIASEVWRKALDSAQKDEVTQFTVAVTDVFTPMGDVIGRMTQKPSKQRQEALAGLRADVANSVLHLFRDVDRMRAVVYALSDDGKTMTPVQRAGRKDKPRSFEAGDKGRGDRAFAVLRTGDPIFESNYAVEQRSYKTYLNVRIAAGDKGFGVLTVDAPRAGSLTRGDIDLVSLLASLLAI